MTRRANCPCGLEFDSSEELLRHISKDHPGVIEAVRVWGREIYPVPGGEAFIDSDPMKCSGCGLCAEACSIHHYGFINKDLARVYIRNFLLPMPKAVVVTCSQCQGEERLCEKACPISPPAIRYDKKTLHMVIDKDSCTRCLACQDACRTEAIRTDEAESPFVCDLCDTKNTGERDPQCVKICPTSALYFHNRVERIRPIRDSSRKSADAKAEMIAKRLHPLTCESIAYPPWRPENRDKARGQDE